MIAEVDLALAHIYQSWQERLLISTEITAWEARRASGVELPGEGCIFSSEDGGKSWTELYLLSMTGDPCGKFSAHVLNLGHNATYMLEGGAEDDLAEDELYYMRRFYNLMNRPSSFRNVTRLTDADRLRIRSIIDTYRQI